MALPDPKNVAYRGINTGNAQCMAYRGFICQPILSVFKNALRVTVEVTRRLRR